MIDTAFIDELASAAPTPGGGGASAYGGALASALASMVGNLTVGKKKYADVEAEVYVILEKLADVRLALLELVDEDARAFGPLAAAYKMPKGTSEEQAEKDAAIQAALVGATDVPLAIMEESSQVIELCDFLAHHGSRLALSDVGVAVAFGKAAVLGASMNVYINASSMDDEALAQGYRERADKLIASATAQADDLFNLVMSEIR